MEKCSNRHDIPVALQVTTNWPGHNLWRRNQRSFPAGKVLTDQRLINQHPANTSTSTSTTRRSNPIRRAKRAASTADSLRRHDVEVRVRPIKDTEQILQ